MQGPQGTGSAASGGPRTLTPCSFAHPYPGQLSPDGTINHPQCLFSKCRPYPCPCGGHRADGQEWGRCSRNRKVSPEGFSGGSGPKHRKRRAWAGHGARRGCLRPATTHPGWTSSHVSTFLRRRALPLPRAPGPAGSGRPAGAFCRGREDEGTRARRQTHEVRTQALALGITSPSEPPTLLCRRDDEVTP